MPAPKISPGCADSFDDPTIIQYLKWLRQVVDGNLGVSYSAGRSVFALIRDSLPAIPALSGAALLLAIVDGITLGVFSAVKRYSHLDHLITVVSFFGLSIPTFWYGLMLIMLFSDGPAPGHVPGSAHPTDRPGV
jgi:peptide/nickel transport system permease protein